MFSQYTNRTYSHAKDKMEKDDMAHAGARSALKLKLTIIL